MFAKPWDEKSRKIFEQLSRERQAYTTDINLSRTFGRICSELEDAGFVDVARIERKNETVFVLRPNVRVRPYKNKKYEFYRF